MYYHDQKNRREGEGRGGEARRGGEKRRGEKRRGKERREKERREERRGERGYFTLFISLETGFGGWPTSSNRLSPWPKKFPSLTPIECAHVYSVCAARLTISLLSLSCHSVSPPLTLSLSYLSKHHKSHIHRLPPS